MKFASSFSRAATVEEAVKECSAGVVARLGRRPDLCIGFVCHPSDEQGVWSLPSFIARELAPQHFLGSTGIGVWGGGSGGGFDAGGYAEVCGAPSLSLLGCTLPSTVEAFPFHTEAPSLPNLGEGFDWARHTLSRAQRGHASAMLLLTDGQQFDDEKLLRHVDFGFPTAVRAGGVATGHTTRLYANGATHATGAAGLLLTGGATFTPISARMAEPFGPSMRVTAAQGALVRALDGIPAAEAVDRVLRSLAPDDPKRLRATRDGVFLLLGVDVSDSRFLSIDKGGDEGTESGAEKFVMRRLTQADAEGLRVRGGDVLVGDLVRLHVVEDGARERGVRAVARGEVERRKRRLQLRGAGGKDRGRTTAEDMAVIGFSSFGRSSYVMDAEEEGEDTGEASSSDVKILAEEMGSRAQICGTYCAGEFVVMERRTRAQLYSLSGVTITSSYHQ